ncbi:signal peptidase II [Patescibacteria group bacterium]
MNKNFTKTIGIFVITALIVFVLDRIFKEVAVQYLINDISIIDGFFRLTYSENTGVAFGLQLPFLVQLFLVPALIVFGFYMVLKHLKFEKLFVLIVTGAIAGGAISNYADRLIHKFVIDYISVWIWPVFNLADIAITVGIFLLVLFYGKIKRV